MATIAVFLALGGGAYAATQLPKNSVGATQIRKNAVIASKIKSNAIDSSKVKNGSLLSQDFKAGQLTTSAQVPPGAKGDAGSQGPQGAKGDAGSQGPQGAKGDAGATAFKAFARIAVNANSATVLASSGGVSVSRVVTGDTDVTFPAPFNAATCAVTATIDSSGATTGYIRKSAVGSVAARSGSSSTTPPAATQTSRTT